MTRLTGPDFWRWMGLRRVHAGLVARFEGRYYDAGRRMPGYLVPDVLDMLITQNLLSVADPDDYGWQRVALTDAGLAEYRALCRRQSQQALPVPPPEHGTP